MSSPEARMTVYTPADAATAAYLERQAERIAARGHAAAIPLRGEAVAVR